MSRPAQLEQQIAHVKQLQEELANPPAPAANNPAPEPVEPTTPQEPVAPAPVIQEPATIAKDEFDKLEQRYRTLQGMHKADTSQLRAELNLALTSIEDLKAQLSAQKQPATPTASKYVTDDDIEEYGDTLDMVRRAAREEAEAVAFQREQALNERIKQLELEAGYVRTSVVPVVENMTITQQEQIRNDFWKAIDTQVPDWETINANPAFIDWLQTEDEVTGITPQYFLTQAQVAYDAPRVIKFFNEWKRKAAGGPTPAPTNIQDPLQQFVAPGASRSTAPVEQKKKTWTRDEISQFYKDSMLGLYRNRPEEKKKIEADIFAAQQEGRVS